MQEKAPSNQSCTLILMSSTFMTQRRLGVPQQGTLFEYLLVVEGAIASRLALT
jgi:hypothetical protein